MKNQRFIDRPVLENGFSYLHDAFERVSRNHQRESFIDVASDLEEYLNDLSFYYDSLDVHPIASDRPIGTPTAVSTSSIFAKQEQCLVRAARVIGAILYTLRDEVDPNLTLMDIAKAGDFEGGDFDDLLQSLQTERV